jgi:hypothetical protein
LITKQKRKGTSPYKDLSEEEKEKVKLVLYITDKFCIGETAYHELAMTDGGGKRPCSYLVKQCKNNLNSLCHITRTPGKEEGTQLGLESELQNTSFICFLSYASGNSSITTPNPS